MVSCSTTLGEWRGKFLNLKRKQGEDISEIQNVGASVPQEDIPMQLTKHEIPQDTIAIDAGESTLPTTKQDNVKTTHQTATLDNVGTTHRPRNNMM